MEKGHAVDDGGLRPPQLSHFPNGDPGDGGGRGPLLAAASCEVLPPTEHVEWVWRRQKTHRIGSERPSCELLEVPEIAAGRCLSTLSTRGRLRRQEELLEAAALLDWEARIRLVAERHIARAEELAAEREREKALLEATMQRRHEEVAARSRALGAVEEARLGVQKK